MATLKSLAAIRAAGGIVPREPVLKTCVWEHYDEEGNLCEDDFSVWVLRQSLGRMAEIHTIDTKDKEAVALALSKTVLFADDKGKPQPLSYEDAYLLEPELSLIILGAAREVNTRGPKVYPQTKNSSANSSSAVSVAAPSKKLENA